MAAGARPLQQQFRARPWRTLSSGAARPSAPCQRRQLAAVPALRHPQPRPEAAPSDAQQLAVTRRGVVALLPSLALLSAAGPNAWQAPPAQAAAAGAATGATPDASAAAASFYGEWPYVQPADILPYLRATATQGDTESVLAAIDTFASYYPMYRSGPEKGRVLEELVASESPSLALELGTFMGYGAIRIARALPPGGRLVSIEADAQQAEVARQVLALAGVDSRVQVLSGLSSEALPALAGGLAPGVERRAGLVFLDHCKPCYLPDLQSMEALGLVGDGTVVVADNVVYPGTPDYLSHVQAPGYDASTSEMEGAEGEESGGASGGSRGHARSMHGRRRRGGAAGLPQERLLYETRLVEAEFEVEQRYKEGWVPQRDALAVSRCLGPAPPEPQPLPAGQGQAE